MDPFPFAFTRVVILMVVRMVGFMDTFMVGVGNAVALPFVVLVTMAFGFALKGTNSK
jgi:hypothetical protein